MLFCTGSLFKIAHFEKCVSSFLFLLRLIDQLSFTIMIASLFPSIPSPATYLKKGPRGFRRRSKSGRKRPGEGSDSGGAVAYLILQIKRPRALTGLNFCSRFTFRVADASYRAHADLCRREARCDGTCPGIA